MGERLGVEFHEASFPNAPRFLSLVDRKSKFRQYRSLCLWKIFRDFSERRLNTAFSFKVDREKNPHFECLVFASRIIFDIRKFLM